jgi:hypothetical protein
LPNSINISTHQEALKQSPTVLKEDLITVIREATVADMEMETFR